MNSWEWGVEQGGVDQYGMLRPNMGFDLSASNTALD